MKEELTDKIVAWASEVARQAAELPSRQARDVYFAECHRELVETSVAEGATEKDAAVLADVCLEAARRVTTELIALRAGEPQGHA